MTFWPFSELDFLDLRRQAYTVRYSPWHLECRCRNFVQRLTEVTKYAKKQFFFKRTVIIYDCLVSVFDQ